MLVRNIHTNTEMWNYLFIPDTNIATYPAHILDMHIRDQKE